MGREEGAGGEGTGGGGGGEKVRHGGGEGLGGGGAAPVTLVCRGSSCLRTTHGTKQF